MLGYPVLGNRQALAGIRRQGIGGALVAIGDNAARTEIAAEMERAGFSLVSIAHPSACLMKDSMVGAGSFIHALSLIGPECRVGRNAIIQPHTCLGHESLIGDGVQFSPGVHIGGKARIGDLSFFGPGAVVYPAVTIGRNVSIGANSVVHRDVADNMVLAGNPARPVRRNPPP